jgi:uncharacterized protein YecT (DUF1311 family)
MRTQTLAALAAICLFGWSGRSAAADAPQQSYSATHTACRTRADGVMPAIRDCDDAEIGRQDKAHNKTYRILKAQLAPHNRALLVAAERAWLSYRRAECYAEAGPSAGVQDYFLFLDACWLRVNAVREQELRLLRDR